MAKNNIQEPSEDDHDFGFSFTDDLESDLNAVKEQLSNDTTKAEEMYKMIMPLLNNLKKNPEKPNIHWPDRVKKIDEFIKKLDTVKNR